MAWNFPNPQNQAVFTLKRILEGSSAILQVVHDIDGDWHFLDNQPVNTEDAAMVGLGEIVNLDSSLVELANLALGSQAVRKSIEGKWEISKIN